MARIANAVIAAAVSKWVATTEAAKHAQLLAEHAATVRAAIDTVERERAGRLLQYTLNKIVDSKYVQAWDRWQHVNASMVRAGGIMQRTMGRLVGVQQACGWERWRMVLAAQTRAGAVMQRCMARILNAVIAAAVSRWIAVVVATTSAQQLASGSSESDTLRAAIKQAEREKAGREGRAATVRAARDTAERERAGRLLQYTLNKIVDSKYVQAWDRWRVVLAAMKRAAAVVQRCFLRISSFKSAQGFGRWQEVVLQLIRAEAQESVTREVAASKAEIEWRCVCTILYQRTSFATHESLQLVFLFVDYLNTIVLRFRSSTGSGVCRN
jgi:hypothetical protein